MDMQRTKFGLNSYAGILGVEKNEFEILFPQIFLIDIHVLIQTLIHAPIPACILIFECRTDIKKSEEHSKNFYLLMEILHLGKQQIIFIMKLKRNKIKSLSKIGNNSLQKKRPDNT